MGTITDKQVFHYTMEGDTVILRYTFTVGGKAFYDDYTYQYNPSGLNIGSKLEIAYNLTNPDQNKPADEVSDTASWKLVIIVLIPVVALISFFGFKAWKEWWVLTP
jgi:hypothetical protein